MPFCLICLVKTTALSNTELYYDLILIFPVYNVKFLYSEYFVESTEGFQLVLLPHFKNTNIIAIIFYYAAIRIKRKNGIVTHIFVTCWNV